MTLKETAIRDYISRIDFNSEDWGLSLLQEDMKKFLGEVPAIDFSYKKDVMIVEQNNRKFAKEVKKLEKISIVFYDLDEKFKKIEFSVI